MPSSDSLGEPVRVGDTTVTPVARVTITRFALGTFGIFQVRLTPRRVEIVDSTGNTGVIEIPDRQAQILALLRNVILVCTILTTLLRIIQRRHHHVGA